MLNDSELILNDVQRCCSLNVMKKFEFVSKKLSSKMLDRRLSDTLISFAKQFSGKSALKLFKHMSPPDL